MSVRVERKLVYAGVCAESFGKASEHLRMLADLEMSDERIRRATWRVGHARIEQRRKLLDEWLAKPLLIQAYGQPRGVVAPPLACVMADGGRYQMLDRQQSGRTTDHWRESRVATFLALESKTHDSDPTPELPAFLRAVSLAKTLAEIGRVPGKNAAAAGESSASKPTQEPPWSRPKILHRTMQASAVCWDEFGALMASHAWYQGFQAAPAKVFVSDGSAAIEKVQQRYFSHYTSVLDLMHALSYALAAARASASNEDEAWVCYVRWAEWIWQGRVCAVIAEWDVLQERLGSPPKEAAADDPREVIRRSRVYYNNHQERMNYPEYRRQGFPLTSSIMESSVKQINRRVKGSEKFWSQVGGEVILGLRADYLSDNSPMSRYWSLSQSTATGQRTYYTAA